MDGGVPKNREVGGGYDFFVGLGGGGGGLGFFFFFWPSPLFFYF